ncbi:MAG: ABC transporter substrate-binding protein, partial [Boseongicola sp. SB0676_bin_33]|nr:ABC transporter substrate-binding protein [Boseongicola sp. SB0676_bin_33]
FGDGAANQGLLMESLNISSLWRLPVLFVCENNGFSEFSPTDTVTSGVISDRARPFGIPVWNIDGNDVVEVWKTALEALGHCRSGAGPAFVEARTYRYSGHFSAEAMILSTPYRSDDEIEAWRARDPVARTRALLVDRGAADDSECEGIEVEADARVEEAVASGQAGAMPEPGTAERLMRAGS